MSTTTAAARNLVVVSGGSLQRLPQAVSITSKRAAGHTRNRSLPVNRCLTTASTSDIAAASSRAKPTASGSKRLSLSALQAGSSSRKTSHRRSISTPDVTSRRSASTFTPGGSSSGFLGPMPVAAAKVLLSYPNQILMSSPSTQPPRSSSYTAASGIASANTARPISSSSSASPTSRLTSVTSSNNGAIFKTRPSSSAAAAGRTMATSTAPPIAGGLPPLGSGGPGSVGTASGASASSGGAGAGGGGANGHGSGGGGAGANAGGSGSGAGGGAKPRSPHMVWYREIVPAMIPVIAIGTGVFLALQLAQTHLSHSRSLADASIRIGALERELDGLRRTQRKQAESWGQGLGRVVRHVATLGSGAAAPQAPAAQPAVEASVVPASSNNQGASPSSDATIPLEASIASTFGVNARARKALADEQQEREMNGSGDVSTTTSAKSRWWNSSK